MVCVTFLLDGAGIDVFGEVLSQAFSFRKWE